MSAPERTRPVETGSPATGGGLYGSSPGLNLANAAVTELVGTFLLVLAITSTAVAGVDQLAAVGSPYNSLSMPIVNGLTLAALAIAFGHVSGAHFNPAVTVALAVTRRFPWRGVAPYVVAQAAGGVAASLVVWAMYGDRARQSMAHLGATAPAPGVSLTTVFVVEAVVTMLLTIVVVAATTDDRAPGASAPLAVGFALAAAVFISAPLSGAGVNPVRALAPMLVSGHLHGWWAYLLAPVLGACVGAVLYDRVLRRGSTPD